MENPDQFVFQPSVYYFGIGGWLALQTTFLSVVWPHITLGTRRLLGIGIVCTIITLTTMIIYSFLRMGPELPNEEIWWVLLILPITLVASIVSFSIALFRK